MKQTSHLTREINVAGWVDEVDKEAMQLLLFPIDDVHFVLVLTFDEGNVFVVQLEV